MLHTGKRLRRRMPGECLRSGARPSSRPTSAKPSATHLDEINKGGYMKNRKKRAQREEVRKILKAMREDLARQRLAYEHEPHKSPMLHLNEMIQQAQQATKLT